MDRITNNPYRILGVFSNASLREITANKTKRAKFASVGKSVALEADMDGVLPPVNRNEASVEKAFADLSLPLDKLKHALFWFVKDTNFDEMALGHLNAGDMEKAKEILEKKENWSSLINLGVLAMIREDYETAVNNIVHVIREYDGNEYIEKFVASICGDTFQIEDDDVMHLFIDALLEELEPMQVYNLFVESDCIIDDDEYVKEKIISVPVGRIKAEISKAKNVDPNDGLASYHAGIALMEGTKSDLLFVKRVCSLQDTAYSMIADSLAKQIMQCGINYYNNTDEDPYYSIDKAMVLQDYACKIAVGSLAKERCQKNAAVLNKVKSEMPPKEIKGHVDSIIELLNNYKDKKLKIDGALQLLKDCAPLLVRIKDYYLQKEGFVKPKYWPYKNSGVKDERYLMLSTAVVNAVLTVVIDEVNKSQQKNVFGSYNMLQIKNTLVDAWEAVLSMDLLDMEDQFRNHRYNPNRKSLREIIEKLNGFYVSNSIYNPIVAEIVKVGGNPMTGYYKPNQFFVFQSQFTIDVDMRTEADFFSGCKTEEEYQDYTRRFAGGRFIAEAKEKLEYFERQRWAKCNILEDYQAYLKQYPRGLFSIEAAAKIKQLEEERLWESSKTKDTIEAYNKYLADTRMSKYAQEASLAIVRIKDEQRRDEAMWTTCAKKDDYEKYLQTFPRALHKKEADERLAKIAGQRQTLIIVSVFLALGIVVALSVLFAG